MASGRRLTKRSEQRRSERRRRKPAAGFWGDRERRRAFLLSLLVHAGVLLGAVWVYVSPPEPEPQPLILELNPPQSGAPETAAAATDTPAAPAATPEVAGNAAEDAAADTVEDAAAPETAARPDSVAPVTPAELAEVASPSEQAPSARVPGTAAPTAPLPVQPPATTLPEIEAVEVAPQPPQQALELPTPNPEVAVAPERRIAVTPQVAVPSSEPLPTPEVAAELAQQEISLPQAAADVAAESAIPQPEVATEVAADVPEPQVSAEVSAAQALPQPAVTADVASRTVPQPQVGVAVAQAQTVPQPSVSSAVVAGESVPEPQAAASVVQAQPLAVTPSVVLSGAVSVATPAATASVTPQVAPEAAAEAAPEAAPAGAADAGNGAQSTQADAAAQAAAGQGAASDDSGAAATGVTNVQSFEVTLEQPLAVLIDNADAAYPQQGLVEASSVFEMPVEGGLTRLMSIYTRNDPAQVGPIRSARDYFLEAALAMNGTLVHVGGAPSAMNRIASQNLPTLDALQDGALFAQASDRAAPHSTFSTGTTLRDAVGRLQNDVSGTLYTPPGDAPEASAVTVNYSVDYSSGFRYLPELDQYRWVRDAQEATDAAQQAVTVDAVVVARVVAFPYPDDPEGRLYLPYSGGEATLYLRGKAIPGGWTTEGGFAFFSDTGVKVDLTPFKSWVLFASEETQVAAE